MSSCRARSRGYQTNELQNISLVALEKGQKIQQFTLRFKYFCILNEIYDCSNLTQYCWLIKLQFKHVFLMCDTLGTEELVNDTLIVSIVFNYKLASLIVFSQFKYRLGFIQIRPNKFFGERDPLSNGHAQEFSAREDPEHCQYFDHSKLLSTFKSYYRQHFNLQAFRQHKLEHYQCLTTHCYPATKDMWIREAPFNLQRASLCARDCGKNVEQIESVQQQAQVKLVREYGERCMKEGSAKQRDKCREEVMREQVEWINKTMSSLIQ